MRNIQILPIVVGITLCTASAAIFYKWYESRSSNKDAVDGVSRKRKPNKKEKVEIPVENEMMPLLVGRNGITLKSIEERCSVEISFRDDGKGKNICQISGFYENVMKASTAINDELKKGKNCTEELIIPKATYTRICSHILRDICLETATQVRNKAGLKDKNKRQMEIKGSFKNVQKARRLIEEQVRIDSDERENEIQREPRYNQRNSPINSSMENITQQSCKSN